MNAHEHIDELAELYAIGALGDDERAEVDASARSCEICAARVGKAEALIAQTLVPRDPPARLDRRMHAAFAPSSTSAWPWRAIVAAAFVAGLLPGVIFGVLHHTAPPAGSDRAFVAMLNSHFVHAQFTPLAPDAPKAKVVYGRGKPWRFFIAQTTRAYAVAAQTQNGTRVLGTLQVNGSAAELFVPSSAARTFLLLDGTRPVARVRF